MRRAFVKQLTEVAASDERIVLMTADLGFMVLEDFAKAFPRRYFNVGVAEANMIGLATGLASCGFIPFVYSIATFATMRGYEQIRNGPVLHNLPVRIVGTGGGFEYGAGGLTHHALEDFGITRVQPGLQVIAPADHEQAVQSLRYMYDVPGPIYFRLGKREDYTIANLDGSFHPDRCDVVREGADLLIVSVGSITHEACQAAEILAEDGIRATVAVVSCLNPPPIHDMTRLLRQFEHAVSVEEHFIAGGLGSTTAEIISENAIRCRLLRCGVRDISAGACGSEAYLRKIHGINAEGIAKRCIKFISESQE